MSLFSLHKNKKREQKHNGREQLWQTSKNQTRARTCSVEAAVTVYKGLYMQDMCVENLGLYSMEDAGILEPSYASFQKDALSHTYVFKMTHSSFMRPFLLAPKHNSQNL